MVKALRCRSLIEKQIGSASDLLKFDSQDTGKNKWKQHHLDLPWFHDDKAINALSSDIKCMNLCACVCTLVMSMQVLQVYVTLGHITIHFVLVHTAFLYQHSKTTAKHPVSHGNCQAAVVEGQMRFRNGGPVLIIDVLSVSASLKSCAETTHCFEDAGRQG